MRGHANTFLYAFLIMMILTIPMLAGGNEDNWGSMDGFQSGNSYQMEDSIGSSPIKPFSESQTSWLDGWDYRKSHIISGVPGAGMNYQIRLMVNYGSGIDNGEKVYCVGKCQADFDDIRFTDDDGVTLLDYWREEYTPSQNATFWVKVADNLNIDATIHMYYGNADCSTLSNGTATFIFFDDFETGAFESENWYDTGDWEIVTSDARHGTYAAHCEGGTAFQTLMSNITSIDLDYGFLYHVWARFAGTAGSAGYPVLVRDISGSTHSENVYSVMVYDGAYCYSQGSGPVSWPSNSSITTSTYYETEVGFDIVGAMQYGWRSRNSMGSAPLKTADGGGVTQITYLFPNAGSHPGQDMWIDDIYLRKWITTEPAHGGWSSNQINWHHDCSNTTNWVIDSNPPFTMLEHVQDGVDILSDGDAIYSDTIPSYPTDSHGIEYFYELPEPVAIERDLNLTVLLNHVGTADRMGGIMVGVFNETKYPIFWVEIQDGWLSSTFVTLVRAIDEYEVGDMSGSWTGYLKVWYNSTSKNIQGQDALAQYTLLENGNYDPEMEVVYVGLVFLNKQSYIYESCRVLDITLGYAGIQESLVPAISEPQDIAYEAGTSGHEITWTISNFTPTSYDIYRNGGLLEYGPWSGENQLAVEIDNLSPGTYNYTAVVHGSLQVTVSDTVFVTVEDTTCPTMGHPLDISYEYGSIDHSIIWTVSDIYPDEYTIYENGTVIMEDTWSSGSIILDIDGLSIARYNFTIVATDSSNNEAKDTVMVTVSDTTAPEVSAPTDIEYEYGSAGNSISWTISDPNPSTYSIIVGTDTIQSSTWSDGTITIDIDDLDLGMHAYSIEVLDDYGNVATDTVIVTVVDTTAPILNHPSDIVVDPAVPSVDVTWQPTDLLPFNYEIYQNGTLVASGIWESGENLSYTILTNLMPGRYNITVVVWDTSGNSDTDTLFVILQEVPFLIGGDVLVISITIGSLFVIVILSSLICRNRAGGGPTSGVSEYYYG